MNSGSYKFEKPETVEERIIQGEWAVPEDVHRQRMDDFKRRMEEEQPTVSLYNLPEHSATDLSVLLDAINERIEKIEPYKLAMSATYTTLTAWMNIVQAIILEKKKEN